MNKKLIKTLVSTAVLGACVMASAQASAQSLRDTSYGYNLHSDNGAPFKNGARSVQDPRDPYTDGAHGANAC